MRRVSKKQMQEDNLCAICMKRKVSADIDCCNHQFCSTCIKDWVKGESKSCPLCRRDVNVISSIKTGGTLYNVRREPDHEPQIVRESDYDGSSWFDSSSYYSESGESQNEDSSSVLSGILNYFGYSMVSGQQEQYSEYSESQEQVQQQKPARRRQQPPKNQKKNTSLQKQKKSSLQQEKRPKLQQKKQRAPSSAFHKKRKTQQIQNPKIQQKKFERKTRSKQQPSLKKQEKPQKKSVSKSKNSKKSLPQNETYSKLIPPQIQSKLNKDKPFQNIIDKYTKLEEERIQAKKKPEKKLEIQKKIQKTQIILNQQKNQEVKKQTKSQIKNLLKKEQPLKNKFLNEQGFVMENPYRKQKYGNSYEQIQREVNEYKMKQYKQIETQYRQQRQRQQNLRIQWREYENEKARKDQEFRKQYERVMKQKKPQKSGLGQLICCLCLICCVGIFAK